MSKTIVLIILCHLMGDYVLQCDFIAQTKGKNWYHLFVHCALYCVPFLVVFGWTWQLAVIFFSHLIIDPLKARWNKITYTQDVLFRHNRNPEENLINHQVLYCRRHNIVMCQCYLLRFPLLPNSFLYSFSASQFF